MIRRLVAMVGGVVAFAAWSGMMLALAVLCLLERACRKGAR